MRSEKGVGKRVIAGREAAAASRRRGGARSGILVATLFTAHSTCWAQEPPHFALETRQEAILLGTGAALGVSALVLGAQVEPLTPAAIAALDIQDVNDFDRSGIAPYRDTRSGDALLVASYAVPLGLLVAAETRREWKTLGALWGEAVLLQLGVNGVVKTTVQRTRPYVYDAATPLDLKTTKSARLSFYSGHTSQAAVNCFFAARVFSSYAKSTALKVLAWSGAAIYPALTGDQRQDSGHHFRTDVITGYCVGAVVGALVPELHRVRGLQRLQAAAVGGGIGIGMRYAWGAGTSP